MELDEEGGEGLPDEVDVPSDALLRGHTSE